MVFVCIFVFDIVFVLFCFVFVFLRARCTSFIAQGSGNENKHTVNVKEIN